MGIVGDLLEAIPSYTGLSPVIFFTLLAVLVGIYYLSSSLMAVPEPTFVPMEPPPPPVQLGDVTEEELKAYDGTHPTKPLLMAIKGLRCYLFQFGSCWPSCSLAAGSKGMMQEKGKDW